MDPMVTPSTYHGNADFKDNWIQTFTGRMFHPFRPDDSEVVVEDIAHALSNICRFTGHCLDFYSVAQHSVIASQLVPEADALWALLHDASEAYICDLSSPVKPGLPGYKELEKLILARIMREFELPEEEPPSVKRADLILVATEARDLMANPPTMWKLPLPPLAGMTVVPWSPKDAEQAFLRRFEDLTR